MMEITLCRHNEIKSRCGLCATDACMRACADCEWYHHESVMIPKQDGRVICPSCQKAIEARAREQAQKDMFVSQITLF